jgi:DNA repair protein RecN (Recombination protein N)
MIKSLYIKNFALIDELEVHFEEGLNILTGQTGAGKSIILGAMNMILGERADTNDIRRGTDKAVAEGIIASGENPAIREILEENAVEYHSELILRREIRDSGSRAFINDTPVTISVLKKVGDFLVDLHGQHDHQLLLREENHQGVLDGFGEITSSLEAYQKGFKKLKSLRKNLKSLQQKEHELKEKRELHRFQVKELEDAELEAGEEEKLEAEINLLDNAEELNQKAGEIAELGTRENNGIISLLNVIKLHLEDLARIEPDFESYREEVSSARISIQEMIDFTERYQAGIEVNPRRLNTLRQRQNELNRLRKKYHRPIPELINYLQDIREELNKADNFDVEIENLKKEIARQAEQLAVKAQDLHDKREETGNELATSIEGELKRLGIDHAAFEVRVDWLHGDDGWINIDSQPVACTNRGCDDVRFYISTNKGEEPAPLAAIASGGEISRVMLALKSTLARQQSLPVMIFDEIDAGISGEVSEKVGRTMRRLSNHCQIIAITHQPQIAGQAHKHYSVSKTEQENRTTTHIRPLSDHEHIHEVASLMSGEDITDAALKSAEQLIEKSTFKN